MGAIHRKNAVQPYRVKSPVKFEIEFISTSSADMALLIPGVESKDSRTVVITGDAFVLAYKALLAAMFLGASASSEIFG